MVKTQSGSIFKCFFSIFNKTYFYSQNYFSIFWPFSCLKSSISFRFFSAKGREYHLSLCFLVNVILFSISRYSFGLTSRVTDYQYFLFCSNLAFFSCSLFLTQKCPKIREKYQIFCNF